MRRAPARPAEAVASVQNGGRILPPRRIIRTAATQATPCRCPPPALMRRTMPETVGLCARTRPTRGPHPGRDAPAGAGDGARRHRSRPRRARRRARGRAPSATGRDHDGHSIGRRLASAPTNSCICPMTIAAASTSRAVASRSAEAKPVSRRAASAPAPRARRSRVRCAAGLRPAPRRRRRNRRARPLEDGRAVPRTPPTTADGRAAMTRRAHSTKAETSPQSVNQPGRSARLALGSPTPSDDALSRVDHVRMLAPNKLAQLLVRHCGHASERSLNPRILDLAQLQTAQ